jgi:hypothetical protein
MSGVSARIWLCSLSPIRWYLERGGVGDCINPSFQLHRESRTASSGACRIIEATPVRAPEAWTRRQIPIHSPLSLPARRECPIKMPRQPLAPGSEPWGLCTRDLPIKRRRMDESFLYSVDYLPCSFTFFRHLAHWERSGANIGNLF